MGSFVFSGLSLDTLIPSLFWTNSQVGISDVPLFSSVSLVSESESHLVSKIILIFVFFFFFCTTVTTPAGFPDHPHRGFHHSPCVSVFLIFYSKQT